MKLRTRKTEIWITEVTDEGEARFLVAPMTPKENFELLEKCKTKEWDRNQRFTDTDFYKFKISKINQTIKDWEGVEDEVGRPLECSRFNKELVYQYNTTLIDRVLDKADKLGEEEEAGQEEEAKNLEAGPNGPAKKDKSVVTIAGNSTMEDVPGKKR